MRTDTEIRSLGFQVLFKYMDIIEAEKFISIINREKFDYTEWRQTLFEDMTIEEISKKAMEHWNRKYGTEKNKSLTGEKK